MVKRSQAVKDKRPARVYYLRRPEMETAEEKLSFIASHPMRDMGFDEVQPDKTHNWINLTNNDFDTLIPLASKETKAAKTNRDVKAIFRKFSLGVVTARDEWVYDFDSDQVEKKVRFLIDEYNAERLRLKGDLRRRVGLEDRLENTIKWSRAVKNDLSKSVVYQYDSTRISTSLYRPFVKQALYFSKSLNEMTYQLGSLFPDKVSSNKYISVVSGGRLNFAALAGDAIPSYAIYSLDPAQCLPLYRYEMGQRVDNITDWALKQFSTHYTAEIGKGKAARKITKEGIFHYCYAVMHDPLYRDKYAQNFKREFPRIPFYKDFWQWAEWGERLMALHIDHETQEPFALMRTDLVDTKARAAGMSPKTLLRAEPASGSIALDSETTLRGIPPQAWTYKLGNRCAIDWVLDQYKEKKPKDATIREKFDTYRFADYKEKVIDLLQRVTTVSVETVKITEAMARMIR
jgi:predicted helicase